MITVPILGMDITEGAILWTPPSAQSQITLMGYQLWAQDEAQNPQIILLVQTDGQGSLLAVAPPSSAVVSVNFLPDGIPLPVGASLMAVLPEPPQLAPVLLHGTLWGVE